MDFTKKVFICRDKDTGYTLFNKNRPTWNDGSKPCLDGSKCWTFAIKPAGLDSPTILKAREDLLKKGFANLAFEIVEIDLTTGKLVEPPVENEQDEISQQLAATA